MIRRATSSATCRCSLRPRASCCTGDQGSPGVVDPGDVLRYTISVQNSGTIPATGVVLRDAVPANTTYVADSTLLNGLAGRPAGWRRLAARVGHRHQFLRPHAAAPGRRRGNDLRRRAARCCSSTCASTTACPAGTLISNQAVVADRGGAGPADRRRRQPGDRARADGRRGGQRPAALDHEAGRGRRRRTGRAGRARSSTS